MKLVKKAAAGSSRSRVSFAQLSTAMSTTMHLVPAGLKAWMQSAVDEAFETRLSNMQSDWDDDMTDAALASAMDEARDSPRMSRKNSSNNLKSFVKVELTEAFLKDLNAARDVDLQQREEDGQRVELAADLAELRLSKPCQAIQAVHLPLRLAAEQAS